MTTDVEIQNTRKKETISETIAGIAEVLIGALFIITFVIQAFAIPSGSMKNTLLVGDHLFVDRLTPTKKAGFIGPTMPYREVHRGDIIVFLKPGEPGLHLVKRVIGIPGDRIHLRDGVLYRNGERVDELYLHDKDGYPNSFRDNFPNAPPEYGGNITSEWASLLPRYVQGEDLVVPPDSYFGMGDNRDVSLDSRYWGFVPRANIIGRPLVIYWSFITPEDQYEQTVPRERAAFIWHIVTHFIGDTRWSRTFRLVH